MGTLERIRATITENRGAILLLVGVLVLLNPQLATGLVDTDSDQYHYESNQITMEEGGTIEWPSRIGQVDSDAACLSTLPSRACALEGAVYANGGIVYSDGFPSAFIDHTYSYVYIRGTGFVEPVERRLDNGSILYGHEPVDTSTAIGRISTPIDRASKPIRAAVRGGSLNTAERVTGANEFIETDGQYYVVSLQSHETVPENEDGSWKVVALEWLTRLLGIGLLAAGHYLAIATAVQRVR